MKSGGFAEFHHAKFGRVQGVDSLKIMPPVTQNQLLQATEVEIARYALKITYTNGALQIKSIEGAITLQRHAARRGRTNLNRKFNRP